MTDKLSSLSIIIPAFNEEKCIRETIQDILSTIDGFTSDYEIIVSDDGSSDRTVHYVESLSHSCVRCLIHGNTGKGGAVARGVEQASKEYLLFMDADNSSTIHELPKLMAFIQHSPIVIGSRQIQGNHNRDEHRFRKLIGIIYNRLIRVVLNLPIRDTQCGFKLFETSVAKELFRQLKETGFVFDTELLYLAKKKGIAVNEAGISWIKKDRSSVHVIRDSIRMFVGLFRIRSARYDVKTVHGK